MKTAVLLAMLLMSHVAAAAHSPTTPPPGWTGNPAEWAELYQRGDHYAKKAHRFVKGANLDCIRSMLIELLVGIEIDYALDPANQPSSTAKVKLSPDDPAMNTNKGNAKRLRNHARDERENACRPPSGGSPTANAEAVARLFKDEPDWEVDPLPGKKGRKAPTRLNRTTAQEVINGVLTQERPALTTSSPWVVQMMKLGIFVSPGGALVGAAASGGVPLPILNPELFRAREADPYQPL